MDMDSELRRVGQFLWRVFVRDADMIDHIAEFCGGIAALVFGSALSWTLTIAIVATTAAFVLGRRAYLLNEKLEPHIELRFGESEKFINARRLRVEAINRSAETAHNCCAFLLAVKNRAAGTWIDTSFNEVIKLKWSPENSLVTDLHSEIHKNFNVLLADGNKLSLDAANQTDVFSEPGFYRMRICVKGDDGVQSRHLPMKLIGPGRRKN